MSQSKFTHDEAVRIIEAAIQSGQTKLIGAHNQGGTSAKTSEVRAQADAAYLTTLLYDLQNAPAPK
ncbi:MAG: hypothetical protein EOP38_20495 [Rubrivivax sp.]|nr:MAG: hypothetical protein EOP38_20495 [Rubrivivax sp.]